MPLLCPKLYTKDDARKNKQIELESAAKVENGKSIKAAAKDYGVDRMTLQRYMKSSSEWKSFLWLRKCCEQAESIFSRTQSGIGQPCEEPYK